MFILHDESHPPPSILLDDAVEHMGKVDLRWQPGFHPVEGVGGSFPPKTPSFPPQKKREKEEKKEKERERKGGREREGGRGEYNMLQYK
jgi:hypothetical protein